MKRLLACLALLSVACVFAEDAVRPLTPERMELLKHSLIHRGDGVGRPDNTMEAMLYTWAKGYTPECDARYTKDRVIVAFHDGSLKKKPISQWLWADLREEDVGSYRGKQFATCRVPTWDTIFSAIRENPNRRIHLDYKDVPPEVLAPMVKRYGIEKQVYFITCGYDLIHRWKKALPEGKAMHWMHLGNWGRLNFDSPEALGMAEAHERALFEKAAAENFKDIDNVQLHVQVNYSKEEPFCPRAATLKAWCDRIHAAGVEASICVWKEEANDPKTYKKLWQLGFDSFGTDYPEALYQAIKDGMK
ncbi:MAG: hypothetical protein IJR99_10190 [Kiritimatiellae bacterium]|nr:hypothetical protein [Kiritimatiellia bacterium]